MYLDPDFDHLTYGDQGERAKQLWMNLQCGALVVFYAAFADIGAKKRLIYAIIGLFIVESFLLAAEVRPEDRDINARSRRVLEPVAADVIIRGQSGVSGRLVRCIPIGKYRDRAYRVRYDILTAWGGLSVKNGYLQRSVGLPRFLYPSQFLGWFEMQRPSLVQSNNEGIPAWGTFIFTS
jgi:hypothetical protein